MGVRLSKQLDASRFAAARLPRVSHLRAPNPDPTRQSQHHHILSLRVLALVTAVAWGQFHRIRPWSLQLAEKMWCIPKSGRISTAWCQL